MCIYKEYYNPETNETVTYNSDVILVDAITGEILGHGLPGETPPFPSLLSIPIGVDLSISKPTPFIIK